MCTEPFGSDFHTILCYSHIVHKLALYTLGTNHMMRIHTCNSALSVEHTHTHTRSWIDLDLGSFSCAIPSVIQCRKQITLYAVFRFLVLSAYNNVGHIYWSSCSSHEQFLESLTD